MLKLKRCENILVGSRDLWYSDELIIFLGKGKEETTVGRALLCTLKVSQNLGRMYILYIFKNREMIIVIWYIKYVSYKD